MKRALLHTCLTLAVLSGLAALFYLPYSNVKEKTIADFNNEQLLLARQTSDTIKATFGMYGKGLRYLSTHESIIHLDETGRHMLLDFYRIHVPGLVLTARLDGNGEILFTTSDPATMPEDLARRALADPALPLKSTTAREIFLKDQTLIALTAPVMDGQKPSGSLVFLISFKHLLAHFISPLSRAQKRRIWLINQDGVVLSCPDPSHRGHRLGEITVAEASSDLPVILQKMGAGNRGTATFTINTHQNNNDKTEIIHHVVFMPVSLPGGNHWSVAIATPEQQILAGMRHFRDSWLLVSSLMLAALLVLGFLLTRTILAANEEKKRKRYEDQLVTLMDFTPIGIVVYDEQGSLLYANKSCKLIWHYDGITPLDHFNIIDLIHPDYRDLGRQRFHEVMRGGTTEAAIIKVILPDGTNKRIELSSAPITFAGKRCGISVMQDVTSRFRSEEEQRLLAAAIANTSDSIVITDRTGAIEYVNPAFSRITGYSKEEALGQNPRILQSGRHDKNFYKKMWQTIQAGRVWEGRLVNRKKDGSLYTEQASISPVRNGTGRITHFVAVKRDISHEVTLEAQLHQARKMEAIGTLAGGIAHDFNNILGAIIGFADLSLRQVEKNTPVHGNLEHIRKSGRRAADLIQQILTFSRQASDQDKIPVAMVPLIKETLKLLRASIPTTIDIRLEMNETEGWILADPVQVQQVTMNLCTNAFHAMSSRGGTLTVSLRRVSETDPGCRGTMPASSCLELRIRDTGEGIDKMIIDRIFDPFFTTKDPGVGTGMGLSVVHGIVQDLSGVINVDSSPAGTVFTILLPETPRPDQAENTAEQEPPRGSGTILVVDDEEDLRETSRRMLEELGYRVATCENPKKALALLADPEKDFDLVLTDQTMPEMTGLELVKELRRTRPALPVIICTGFSEQLDEIRAGETGAKKLLNKPFSFRELAEAVSQVLRQTGKSSPPEND